MFANYYKETFSDKLDLSDVLKLKLTVVGDFFKKTTTHAMYEAQSVYEGGEVSQVLPKELPLSRFRLYTNEGTGEPDFVIVPFYHETLGMSVLAIPVKMAAERNPEATAVFTRTFIMSGASESERATAEPNCFYYVEHEHPAIMHSYSLAIIDNDNGSPSVPGHSDNPITLKEYLLAIKGVEIETLITGLISQTEICALYKEDNIPLSNDFSEEESEEILKSALNATV